MAFENVQANPYDMMVQTGLQDPPSNQTVFLKAFDKDHLSGERFFSGGERVPFEPMMDRITSSNVTADFRHAQQDFDGNGYYAPSNKLDALAIGGSPHGAHPAVDDFMRPLFEQIMERATQVQEQYKALKIAELDARTSPPATQADYDRIETDAKIIADNFAAREHAAVTNFRALALQEGGIPEAKALMGLPDDQTLLAYNDTDLRNPHDRGTPEYAAWDAQKSSLARQTFTMDKITGVIDLDRLLAINVDRDLINPDPDAQKFDFGSLYEGGSAQTLVARETLAGKDFDDLSNNRFAVDENGLPKFLTATDPTPQQLEWRAEFIAKHKILKAALPDGKNPDALTGDNALMGAEKQALLARIEGPEFDELKDRILTDLQDTRLYPDRSRLPNDFDQYILKLSTDGPSVLGAQEADLRWRSALKEYVDIVPEAIGRADRYLGGLISRVAKDTGDFLPDGDGSVSTRFMLTAPTAILSTLVAVEFVQTKWRAETADMDQPFLDWVADKAPEFAASAAYNGVSAVITAGLVAGAFALAGPVGWVAVAILGTAAFYDGYKEYLRNYLTAEGYSSAKDAIGSDDPIVARNAKILFILDEIEKIVPIEAIAEAITGFVGALPTLIFGMQPPPPVFSAYYSTELLISDEHGGAWAFGHDAAKVIGNDFDNVMIHDGYGELSGGGGSDTLIGWRAKVLQPGELVGEYALKGYDLDDIRVPADRLLSLTLDGGAGDDWVLALFGERALTIGGEGRDWIFNTSWGGVIHGDRAAIDGEVDWEETTTDPVTGETYYAHADKIWFWGGTTMKDPTKADKLAFFGYPLVGGTNDLGYFLGPTNAVVGFGATSASAAFNPYYIDYFMPFITYYVDSKTKTLSVLNMVSVLFGELQGIELDPSGPQVGVMRFDNYDEAVEDYFGAVVALRAGYTALSGDVSFLSDMGMVFKRANPLLAFFSMLPGVPGGLNRTGTMRDDLLLKAAAVTLIAKSLAWSVGADPLILDLDGDGIETIDIDDADVWFDLDGDLFAEKTGWLNPAYSPKSDRSGCVRLKAL